MSGGERSWRLPGAVLVLGLILVLNLAPVQRSSEDMFSCVSSVPSDRICRSEGVLTTLGRSPRGDRAALTSVHYAFSSAYDELSRVVPGSDLYVLHFDPYIWSVSPVQLLALSDPSSVTVLPYLEVSAALPDLPALLEALEASPPSGSVSFPFSYVFEGSVVLIVSPSDTEFLVVRGGSGGITLVGLSVFPSDVAETVRSFR